MRKVKVLFVSLALMMSLAMLSGCSLFGPKDAAGVIERYNKAIESVESYHMKGDISFNERMTIENQDVIDLLGMDTIDMPISMSFDMDCGKESAHGDIDASVDVMGQSSKSTIEMYLDSKDKCSYIKTDENSSWEKTDMKEDESITSLADLKGISTDSWKSFEFAKTDDGYKLSASIKDLKDAEIFDSIYGTLGDTTVSDFELSDDGEVVYLFNKDCLLTNVEMTGVKMSGKADMGSGLGNLNCDIDMDVKVAISDYNAIEASKYEVPKDVKDSAISGDSDSLFDFGDGEDVDVDDGGSDIDTGDAGSGNVTPSSGDGILLSADAITGNPNKYCYVVGKDIPKGTYGVYLKSGQGVWDYMDNSETQTSPSYSCGYNLGDDMQDGFTVVLDTDDEIYMSGDNFVLEFRPIN